ncbi:hypothetical protein AWENTII_011856 [Aspergillus wentii]
MEPRKLTHDAYSVGWVCVRDCEVDAARALLDEEDEPLDGVNDDNSYLVGRIGKHNVVIAFPASSGSHSTIQTVTNMIRTFPKIRFGLMVGVGGGVPNYPRIDIRLGDVVVSEPGGTHGGVLQYDKGKWLEGQFEITSHLNRPPSVLQKAIKRLRADHRFRKGKMQSYIEEIIQKLGELLGSEDPFFPGVDRDILFLADYHHVGGEECTDCDKLQVVQRKSRTQPLIHHGLIASGDIEMRSAKRRDELRDAHKILCFEMEAAGLMNHFPCLVIRGISNYSDSHMNEQWQPYAAVVAAAYAKDLLRIVNAEEISNTELAASTFENIGHTLCEVDKRITKMDSILDDGHKMKILNWLTPSSHGTHQSNFFRKAQKGTGTWLLESDKFQQWLHQTKGILFCQGIPGAGKTIMTSIVINHLNKIFKDSPGIGIAYIYCDFLKRSTQTRTSLFSSLLKQLSLQHQNFPNSLLDLYMLHGRKQTNPSFDELFESLEVVCNDFERTIIIIDALDEIQDPSGAYGSANRFLSEVFRLQERTNTSLFATSRFGADIEGLFNKKGCTMLEIRASDDDIRNYLEEHISELPSLRSDSTDLASRIKDTISGAAGGMFLVAWLYLHSFKDKTTIGQARIALEKPPSGSNLYDRMYGDAMERIQCKMDGLKDLAMRVLLWVFLATQPVTVLELQHALALAGDRDASVFNHEHMTDAELITSMCSGLVTVDCNSQIVRLVHYTTHEYFDRNWTTWFPNGHSDIASTCIAYLSLDVFETSSHSKEELDDRLQLYPLYSYSAKNWGVHARRQSVAEALVMRLLGNENKVHSSAQVLQIQCHCKFRSVICACDFHAKCEIKPSALHLAVYFGLEGIFQILLLNNGHAMDARDSHGRTALSWAAEHGHEGLVRCLLESGADATLKDIYGHTAFARAAKSGHYAIAKILANSSGIDSNDISLQLAFLRAACHGFLSVVQLFLGRGFDPRFNDPEFGRTPLSQAAEYGQTDIVRLFLDIDIDPNSEDVNGGNSTQDNTGKTPLMWAAMNDRLSIAQLLLEKGADPSKQEKDGQGALYFAITKGHIQIVMSLLDHGVDIHAKSIEGHSALHEAAMNNHSEIVALLLNRGCDANARDLKGNTALHHAGSHGNRKMALSLLDHGADINARAIWQNTAIHNAITYEGSPGPLQFVRLLLSRGFDVSSRDIFGLTVLHSAASNGWLETVELLLSHGIDINAKGEKGNTALHFAITNGHLEIAKLLIEQDIDVNVTDEKGTTALHFAVSNGHLEIVNLLLEKDINVNITRKNGNTACHIAAKNGRNDFVELLLNRGLNTQARNLSGQTILHLAIQGSCDVAIIKLLLDRGVDLQARDTFGLNPLETALAAEHLEAIELLLRQDISDEDAWPALYIAADHEHTVAVQQLLARVKPNSQNYERALQYAVYAITKDIFFSCSRGSCSHEPRA